MQYSEGVKSYMDKLMVEAADLELTDLDGLVALQTRSR